MRKSKQRISKKKLFALCASLLLLGGCGLGSVETMSTNYLQDAIFENEEIANGYSYYEQSEAEKAVEGEKTEDGEEKKEESPEQAEQIDTTGKVRVTFADNSLLKVSYYSDAELKNKIETENCYLEPNSVIYASKPESKGAYSNMYFFEGLRIYEFDEEGNKKLKDTVKLSEGNLSYQVPDMTEGNGIAIVPVGVYAKRVITLNDYFLDSDGNRKELLETWILNDKDERTETTVEVSPFGSYLVTYKYDNAKYYFVSAEPEKELLYPKEKGNTEGKVVFEIQEPESAVENYSVELHGYLSAIIDNEAKGLVYVQRIEDNKEIENIKIEDKIPVGKLKCGTILKIKTDKVHKLRTTQEIELVEKEEDGYVYTFKVPEVPEGEFNFKVYAWDQKDISVTIDDQTENETNNWTWLENFFNKDKGKEPILKIRSGESVYNFEELQSKGKITLNENEELEIIVTPNLPEEIEVRIVVDNKEPFVVRRGSEKLNKKLSDNDISSSLKIIIQNITNENIKIPADLKVVLDKSLANSTMLFNLEASGERKITEASYLKGKETIFEGIVNAEKKIVLSAKNIQLYQNTALKIDIRKDDGTHEIRYCNGSSMYETISAGINGNFSSDISINISLVNVSTYKIYNGKNCSVKLRLADTNETVLLDGELLEGSRKVIVTITAADDYYIEGDKYIENNTIYQREMEFSEYLEKIDKILLENPVKKFIKAAVDVSAPYQVGTVTVVRNGKEKITETGNYCFMEGEEIEFTLQLNKNSGYYIVGEGLFEKDWNGKRTAKIVVTYDMEGTVISAGDCIEVKKEE